MIFFFDVMMEFYILVKIFICVFLYDINYFFKNRYLLSFKDGNDFSFEYSWDLIRFENGKFYIR